MSSCVYGVPQEMCAVVTAVCCEGEQDCTGVFRSVVLQSCLAPVEWLVCTVLSLPVGGFPLVLSHLFTQSESAAVRGQETGLWRWAVGDAMSRRPCMGWQLGKASATAEYWFSFSSSAG